MISPMWVASATSGDVRTPMDLAMVLLYGGAEHGAIDPECSCVP